MSTLEELIALRDDELHINCVDSCSRCGDPYCDGIGCIANLDPDNPDDHEAIEELHTLFREGQAWRVLQALLEAGATPLVALILVDETLANANNQTVTETCDECEKEFLAVGPCDTTCTLCRLKAL